MILKAVKTKSFFKLTIFFLVGLFGIAAVLPVSAGAAGTDIAKSYIIKFIDPTMPEGFASNTTALKPRFVFSNNRQFSNIYTFDSRLSLNELRLALTGQYDFLEVNRQLNSASITVQPMLTTNDPGFTANPLDVDKQWGLSKAGFTQAWETTTGSLKNVVAVIDTGVDATHEDLQEINWVNGFDFVKRQAILGKINSDDNGHGTLVTGILGATANNAAGITGANWKISIMPLKALAADGKGDAAAVSEAIVWATDNKATIINLSIGGIGFGHDTTLANAVAYAFARDVVLVSAGGNDMATTGTSMDSEPVYPICADNNQNMIIGVAATDQNDLKPSFSNYGKNCIDVSAPGKRILSTINYDPLTKKYAPNSYAYASGTSLAVPLVAAQAALIKSIYSSASNQQIRDRIISTADPIDDLNTTQCGGHSCKGLIGSGRINVVRSLATAITPVAMEGDLVKTSDTGLIYLISGGRKRLVSPFVMNQRYQGRVPKGVDSSQLANFPEGAYALPEDGTLIKLDNSPTVYYILNGQKLPVTSTVFEQRKFSFASVRTVSFPEFNSWIQGSFLAPTEGTLLRTQRNKTVYWVVGGSLHPVNSGFYREKGLNVFPVLIMPDQDVAGFARGEAYIK